MIYMLCDSTPARLPLLVGDTLTDIAKYLDRPRKSVDITISRWRAFIGSQAQLNLSTSSECPIRSRKYGLFYLCFLEGLS